MQSRDKTYAQKLVTERTGREVSDLLRELYVEKRHSQEEIAQSLGVHRVTVTLWLKEFGIRRADRAPVTL